MNHTGSTVVRPAVHSYRYKFERRYCYLYSTASEPKSHLMCASLVRVTRDVVGVGGLGRRGCIRRASTITPDRFAFFSRARASRGGDDDDDDDGDAPAARHVCRLLKMARGQKRGRDACATPHLRSPMPSTPIIPLRVRIVRVIIVIVIHQASKEPRSIHEVRSMGRRRQKFFEPGLLQLYLALDDLHERRGVVGTRRNRRVSRKELHPSRAVAARRRRR